ncbi:MAG: glycosyltransferase family 4 protein [Phycisphaerales bacterium]
MHILFHDPACPAPYSPAAMTRSAISGTHASLVRVAEALASSPAHHTVTVAQHNRTVAETSPAGVRYIGFDALGHIPLPGAVILSRQVRDISMLRQRFPGARLIFWLQTMPSPHYHRHRAALLRADCTVVAVSRFHQRALLDALRPNPLARALGAKLPPVHFIYNPIGDDLRPDPPQVTPRDPDKLVFFSSPHKGLDQVLAAFALARRQLPNLKLHLANPGYLRDADSSTSGGIVPLGSLPQHQILQHVRQSFCVFYPQTSFLETFGCVFAEANAVGTPVLAAAIGSAPEVLSHPDQLLDPCTPRAAADRLVQWRTQGAPHIAARDEFRISRILPQWLQLIAR